MLKNKRLNKHFKKAQQIVELALVLPFFIICFSFVFQLMVETYAKYKFSYIFTHAISRAIELQQENLAAAPYKSNAEAHDFNFKHDIGEITKAFMRNVPNNGIQINDLQMDGVNNYMSGVYITDVQRIFFKSSGLEYFYFIVPVNRIYFQPMILNVSNGDYAFFSNWFYPTLKAVYTPPAPAGGGAAAGGGGGTSGGARPPLPAGGDPSSSTGGGGTPPEAEPPTPSGGDEPAGYGEAGIPWGEAGVGG